VSAVAAAVAADTVHTAFHGRQLHGGTVNLAPAVGYVVHEQGESDDGGARVKDFRVTGWFDKITYWNHAEGLSAGDWLPKLMEWQRDSPLVRQPAPEARVARAWPLFITGLRPAGFHVAWAVRVAC
jgi:hypothetical protein